MIFVEDVEGKYVSNPNMPFKYSMKLIFELDISRSDPECSTLNIGTLEQIFNPFFAILKNFALWAVCILSNNYAMA